MIQNDSWQEIERLRYSIAEKNFKIRIMSKKAMIFCDFNLFALSEC